MSDHKVSNLRAAVDLAESWRAAGTHTWFRGQNRLWPLLTSLARRRENPEETAQIEARIELFCNWLEGVPELRHLLQEEHVHGFFAILQHYGVPTHYIDFTVNPRVAGFFAGVGPCATPGEEGCIIAINPDQWVDILRSVAEIQRWDPDTWPEKVVVEVPNLWRLEAQSGHFIYLPLGNAEAVYPYDRIVFVHDNTGFELTEEEVYPSRKSQLEDRLDEFFTKELMLSNQQHLREMAKVWSVQGQHAWITMEQPTSISWLRPGRGVHESWESVAPEWSAYVHETLLEVCGGTTARLRLDTRDPLRSRDELQEKIELFLAENPQARRKAIHWNIVPSTSKTPKSWIRFVERALGRAWDGVRRLPFTDGQVAATLAMTAVLACADMSESPSYSMQDFAAVLAPIVPIELANAQSVTARAAMAKTTYEHALRPDINEVLVSELLDRPREQLRQVLGPAYLFHFGQLVDAFARELIPTQVLIQRPDLAVFFSPSRVSVIGAP